MPPPTADLQNVKETLQNRRDIHAPATASPTCRRDKRLDQASFRIRQITRILSRRNRRPELFAVSEKPRATIKSRGYEGLASLFSCNPALAHAVQMLHNLIKLHDVDVFVVQIEEIDLVNQLMPVERAFLHQRDVEAVRIRIDA